MNTKDKAKDLVLKYSILKDGHNDLVKQCALIAVDEIMNCDWHIPTREQHKKWTNYWQEVKNEIEKL